MLSRRADGPHVFMCNVYEYAVRVNLRVLRTVQFQASLHDNHIAQGIFFCNLTDKARTASWVSLKKIDTFFRQRSCLPKFFLRLSRINFP